jgi:hypothetical protein
MALLLETLWAFNAFKFRFSSNQSLQNAVGNSLCPLTERIVAKQDLTKNATSGLMVSQASPLENRLQFPPL